MKRKAFVLIVALALVAVMICGLFAGCDVNKPNPEPGVDPVDPVDPIDPGKDTPKYDTITIGSITELGGDFRWTGIGTSAAGSADQDVQKLTSGYATMQLDRTGIYQWNKTAVKSHNEEVTADGSYKITIELNQGLTMSNGEEVKAVNYLAYILAMSTPVSKQGVDLDTAGNVFVGYDAFAAYKGEGDPVPFSGLRLLDDYKFSIEISSEYYPYYYVETYGVVTPYDLKLVLGDGVEVKDDGNGAYLSSAWFEKDSDGYKKAEHLKSARYDISTYAYTGPYVVSKWNEASKEATMKLNPYFKGDYTGRIATIPTIVYRKVVSATQINDLKSGQVDIIEGLTGGTDVNAALGVVAEGGFAQNHYDRAGYGKIQFDCDFGPAMFAEVRQAIAYSFNRNTFANDFCTGYGSVVSAPYSVNFDAVITLDEDLIDELNEYPSSLASAKSVLTAGGWTYNSKGEDKGADWAPGSGVDSVRYKKLSASEYGTDDINKNYAGVTSEGVDYKTVKIGDDYYMPLVINWMSSKDNEVSELLTTQLKGSKILKDAGILITKTEVDFTLLLGNIYRYAGYGFDGNVVYSMYNLATGWNSSVYDYSYNWIDNSNSNLYEKWFGNSVNKLSDPYDAAFSWWDESKQGLSYDEAVVASNGKLGMNYISMAMVYSVEPGDTEEYNKWFKAYLLRWNELLPDIPLYSNIYYDIYNSNKLSDLKTGPFWGAAEELIYQDLK